MMRYALQLGPLKTEGAIHRSGVQWLVGDDHYCRANEVIGFCNLSLTYSGRPRLNGRPLDGERELQVAFAPRRAGRLKLVHGGSLGGFLDAQGVSTWNESDVVAYLEADDASGATEPDTLRLLVLTGRRLTDLDDQTFGLLPSWHNRVRGWWCDQETPAASLLAFGICDATGSVRGDRAAFTELFEIAEAPAHIVSVANHPILPCAPVLLEQMRRRPADLKAVTEDAARAISSMVDFATADDYLFLGAYLKCLETSPITESYEIISPHGLVALGAAKTVLLSLNAESATLYRHKKLGYLMDFLLHHQRAAGPAFRKYLETHFEPVRRSIDDMRKDYLNLIEAVRATTGARVMIMNRMSTSGQEDIVSYSGFDAPLSATLSNVASKELNLMLHDLESETDVEIIDVDAMAAELGGGLHLPDGIHQSGPLQTRIRAEILSRL